jgi:hypothetical protein
MDIREHLRMMRKEMMRPVSRMPLKDVAAEIEKLRNYRETTAAPAAVPSAPARVAKAAAETIKEAKATEFPIAPGGTKKGMERKTARKAYEPAPAAEKKKMSKKEMMALISELSSDEE